MYHIKLNTKIGRTKVTIFEISFIKKWRSILLHFHKYYIGII